MTLGVVVWGAGGGDGEQDGSHDGGEGDCLMEMRMAFLLAASV